MKARIPDACSDIAPGLRSRIVCYRAVVTIRELHGASGETSVRRKSMTQTSASSQHVFSVCGPGVRHE